MDNSVAIVIPVYKEELSKYEIASLKRCVELFQSYDIFLVTYNTLDLKNYKEIYGEFKVKYYKKVFFDSINGYNRLMLNLDFYKSFSEYEYILIHQLDVFVFKNELNNWLSKNYDYIGAPWKSILIHPNLKYSNKAGNGGFSLRKVKKFISVLRKLNKIYSFSFIFNRNKKKGIVKSLLKSIYFYTLKNNFHWKFNDFDRNEDMFWGLIVPEKIKDFSVPTAKESASFCIENDVEFWMNYVNSELPMATHAYVKNFYYWKNHIKI